MTRLLSIAAFCLLASACAHQPLHQDPAQAAMNDALHPVSPPALAGASTDGKEVCSSSNGGAVACAVNAGLATVGKIVSGK
ncbi:hypothetical protein [Pinirhizobacter soli]|uniref:hypothetical protein n=1 Tax=Pinirhizobacter soli TaxID=2786953 RepID=UPI00202A7857|nr:hypothetical protein [Pinirhizobacter soli]